MSGVARAARGLDALEAFVRGDFAEELERHRRVDAALLALALFHETAREVPAYARFLRERGVEPEDIQSPADFTRVPPTSKAQYQRAYPLSELCRAGALSAADFFAVSSGSTGEPSFWPRFSSDEFGTAARFEQVLVDGFELDRKRTLGVVCFSLGSWVGGMYTTFACRYVALKGYPLTLVTPGNSRAEILRVLRALAPEFEQVVLFGYPPFLKDVIDAGRADGFDWSRQRVCLVTAGEVFSEEWRTLVCDRLGGSDDRSRRTASLYGTADGGVLANETPLSVRIRGFLAEHPNVARELFGEARLPTLCQYDPLHRYFEAAAGELLFSADGTLPLVRYRILDRGGVVPFARMLEFLRENGCDPLDGKGSSPAIPVRELPFVYVFGRTGFALSFYGANVYPENVSVGLEQAHVAASVTGKFVMELVHDAEHDVTLAVTVELAAGVEPSDALTNDVQRSIQAALERLNSEYSNYAPRERRAPRVRLLPLAHPEYFPPGVKHRYTR